MEWNHWKFFVEFFTKENLEKYVYEGYRKENIYDEFLWKKIKKKYFSGEFAKETKCKKNFWAIFFEKKILGVSTWKKKFLWDFK